MPDLALVLSGAVSLGSWEAGVLDELLYQLDRLNRDRDGEDPFRIDVITGASAGAMAAALVARAVMIDLDDRKALREAWVDEIDITHLLEGIPPNALLAKGVIGKIAGRHLAAPEEARPSSLAPERLLMRFALTNMSGVDYALPANKNPNAPDTRFVSTFHAEHRELELNRSNRLEPRTWGAIREAAIASGNFPFAFPPHRLDAWDEPWDGHALDPFPDAFTYIDGGLFNNEPLGQAVGLARKLDGSPERPGIDPGRIFLLVDANLNHSKHDPEFGDRSSLPDTVVRTLAVLLSESSALDWLKARRFNNETGWRNDLLELLAGLVQGTAVDDPETFLEALERAADDIVARKRALFPSRYPPDYRTRAVERTLASNARLAEGMGPVRRQIFGTLAFLLNSVAGLDKKEQLNLHVLYTTPGETAGDRMRSFAGFFNREWRLHDYRVGRQRANTELPWILEGKTGAYEREPGVVYDGPDLGDVDMDGAPLAARKRLRDATLRKVDLLSRHLRVGPRWMRWATGPLARWGLRKVVRSKLDEVLRM